VISQSHQNKTATHMLKRMKAEKSRRKRKKGPSKNLNQQLQLRNRNTTFLVRLKILITLH